ncbi:helix-turn-helix domain-containing protein [Magnetospirillum gryphiswaldense]|uniref:HTH cro/C1-type domain-containing protein n=2 Tax=Magnetospirillum gryphiswaldense TaxID=55518 RepID=V6EWB1_MAGGM|nr:helix-turn-helix transcriptional regulator [Magnetospirillum gryphiswaldense]AVM74427.1 Helix-turn-helix domain protein [Magnetospirillum gryphiswaldense MSR-1]AVM78330.1 Helix-turn-helix domain protein [Magnetospirillum gryphiswaldense]CAM74533.1 hypothetical protein MGR_0098 [Magnetospirillum gryphiswaldense MSR-1]CDK97479.1 conserved protein of unknown function, containing helix-turn-helix domain [Magnetospirillum gryphiswaldense MSR-1 v2]
MNHWQTQLRVLRRYHGLKQAVLAEMIGVDQATVSRWENGHQEPDLAGKKRMRDLLRKFSARLEVDISTLMSSPIVDRSLVDANFILRDVSNASIQIYKFDKPDVLGKNINSLRNDTKYEKLFNDYKRVMIKGEFTSLSGTFFSSTHKKWIRSYTVPVIISGEVHFLSDRIGIIPSQDQKPEFQINLLDI